MKRNSTKKNLEKVKNLENKKKERSLFKKAIYILSIVNSSASGIFNLLNIIGKSIITTNIVKGNLGTSIALNVAAIGLDIYSLTNYLKEENIYKKSKYEKNEKEKQEDKNKLQSLCLDIISDILFLTGSITAIALYNNPIALIVTVPFIILGGSIVIGSSIKSTINQVQLLKSYALTNDGKEKVEEYKKEIKTSTIYKTAAKFLPETIVLAKWHNKKRSLEKQEILNSLEGKLNKIEENYKENITNFSKTNKDIENQVNTYLTSSTTENILNKNTNTLSRN